MQFRPAPSKPQRPYVLGTRHAVVAGHYMAAQAGLQVLEAGGNAVDAGVATGIATGVVESQMVSIAGVAPIVIYLADSGEIVTISGLGTWPKAASCEYFRTRHGGAIPKGILRSVVPAAPDAWITALERYGTMSFGEVAAAAIRFAKDGFPMYPQMSDLIKEWSKDYRSWPSSAAIYLPQGRAPEPGERFVQADVARALQYLVDEEAAAAKRGRAAGLHAARNAFYRGDIATTIDRYYRENGGLLTADDLASFRVGIEPPVHTRFGDVDFYGCGPWCQGPMMLQALNLVDSEGLRPLGHNSAAYIHTVAEAIKLAAADREAFYGDPRFVDVPMGELLSASYAKARRSLIRPDQAWRDMPPAGDPWSDRRTPPAGKVRTGDEGHRQSMADTSYFCVVDRHGNAFSATPSDGSSPAPVVPGLGFMVSPRGSSSWTDPRHASSIAPGKRPRLTPNPALAIRPGRMVMPFGSPGGDVQTQAMLQAVLNLFVFEMDPQSAVEAPRFATYGFPSSFEPHDSRPGRLNLEPTIARNVGEALAGLGHDVDWWPDRPWVAGSVCLIARDPETGILCAAADNRRTSYAVGW